jgi:hypothetical protein
MEGGEAAGGLGGAGPRRPPAPAGAALGSWRPALAADTSEAPGAGQTGGSDQGPGRRRPPGGDPLGRGLRQIRELRFAWVSTEDGAGMGRGPRKPPAAPRASRPGLSQP